MAKQLYSIKVYDNSDSGHYGVDDCSLGSRKVVAANLKECGEYYFCKHAVIK